jgi:hypothetical protein
MELRAVSHLDFDRGRHVAVELEFLVEKHSTCEFLCIINGRIVDKTTGQEVGD